MAAEARLARLRAARRPGELTCELEAIALRCAALPVLDDRSEAEIVGYDDDGLPA